MNYDTMDAGREMDALVAEKVMGYIFKEGLTKYGNRGNGWGVKEMDFVNQEFLDNFKPSTSIAAAWGVMEKMAGFTLENAYIENDVMWSASFWNTERIGWFRCEAITAPLAICRAALKAAECPKSVLDDLPPPQSGGK